MSHRCAFQILNVFTQLISRGQCSHRHLCSLATTILTPFPAPSQPTGLLVHTLLNRRSILPFHNLHVTYTKHLSPPPNQTQTQNQTHTITQSQIPSPSPSTHHNPPPTPLPPLTSTREDPNSTQHPESSPNRALQSHHRLLPHSNPTPACSLVTSPTPKQKKGTLAL